MCVGFVLTEEVPSSVGYLILDFGGRTDLLFFLGTEVPGKELPIPLTFSKE